MIVLFSFAVVVIAALVTTLVWLVRKHQTERVKLIAAHDETLKAFCEYTGTLGGARVELNALTLKHQQVCTDLMETRVTLQRTEQTLQQKQIIIDGISQALAEYVAETNTILDQAKL